MKRWMMTLTFFFLFLSFSCICQNTFIYAQSQYPSKPVNFLIGYPPGGLSDLTGRALAMAAEKALKQPIVVVNKPGASSSLQMVLLAQAKPDGYTIGSIAVSATVVMPLIEKMTYNPLKDFTYICNCFNYAPALVVRTDSPWRNFKEFVDFARQNPGVVKYGTHGAYGTCTLVMEGLSKKLGVQWDTVPFKSDPAAVTALLGGHVTAAASPSNYAPHVRAGKLRILALMSPKRSPEFPEAPTLKDLGYDLVAEGFIGVAGPMGMPESIVRKLEEAFTQAVKDPAYLELLKQLGLIEDYKNGKDFAKYVAGSFYQHDELIHKLGLDVSKLK
ncbi:MAG: tripartite tricarboxylate transporter substrate binding protein [Thermodesulfobacteriota bacterium]|jgi:tripartite-type tricarboxylate transporter receptor subunit TctC